MDHLKHFISVGPYTVNTDRIDYVEQLPGDEIAIHFTGDRKLVLGKDDAERFRHELAQSVSKVPNWT